MYDDNQCLTIPSGQSPDDEDYADDSEYDVTHIAVHRHK